MRVKLTEICTPKQWKTIPANELLGKGYPVYGANGIIGYYNEYNHENPVVAITCRGATCGTINITVPQSYVTGNAMCLDDTRSDILPEYLYYCLLHYDFNNVISGSAQPQITRQGLEKVEIKYYPIEAQKKIVAILSKTRAVITAYHQQLQKLDELVKAQFVEMFGDPEINSFDWPVCTLKELVSIEPQNGLYKPQSAYVRDGSGFPIVRIDAFYNGRITNFSTLKRLECSESEVQRYLLQENDIVINRVNSIEYLGKCAHIKGLLEETVFESNMMRLHLDDTVMNAVFATKLLCSQYIYKQIMIRAKKSVNQASINQQDVLSFRMFVPPLELQEQFAAFVEQVDKSKVVVQKALDEAQLLFDSLMQKYFG